MVKANLEEAIDKSIEGKKTIINPKLYKVFEENELEANSPFIKKIIKYEKILDNKNSTREELAEAGNFLRINEKEIKEIIKDSKKLPKENKEEGENELEELGFGYGYIWEDDKVMKTKYFPTDILNNNIYFGVLIPMIVDDVVKVGKKEKVVGKKQVMLNHIITPEGLFRINQRFREDHNLDFRNLPRTLPKRWNLKDIKNYLDKKSKPVDSAELLDTIISQYQYYLHIRNKTWYKILALWDLGSYMHMGFSAFPFIEHRGIAGTGKTKGMVISSFISFNGSEVMVNPTESTLFREKEENRGATYFDEAEKLWVYNKATKQYEGDTRTELINSAYSKSGKVPRQERIGNTFVTKWYSPYGPTQLASINGLFGATATRSITRITTKSPNDDPRGEREPEDDINNPLWAEIRDKCYRFSLDNWKEINKIYNNFPKDVGLKRRDLQLWRPLLSIAKFIDESIYEEVLEFAKEISERNLDDLIHESSFDYSCLKALRTCIFDDKDTKVYVNGIKIRYCQQQNKNESLEDRYLNRNISNHLDKLGFKELRKRDNRGSYFLVNEQEFNEIVNPICPELAISSTPSTPSTPLHINNINNSVDGMSISDDKNPKKVTIVTISDENVDGRDMKGKNNSNKIDFKEAFENEQN